MTSEDPFRIAVVVVMVLTLSVIDLRHPGRQSSCRMAEPCRSWGRFAMGDDAVRAGKNGRTGEGDPVSEGDSSHVPQ